MQHAWSLSLRLNHRDKEMGLSYGQTGVVCFSLLLCRALGLSACPELAFWLSQSHEAQESKLLRPPGPGGPESRKLLYTRCGLCWPPGFSKAAGVLRAGHTGCPLEAGQAWGLSKAGRQGWGGSACGSHDSVARWGWRQVLGAERACSFTEAVSPSSPAQARYRKKAKVALSCASIPRKVLTCPCPPGML